MLQPLDGRDDGLLQHAITTLSGGPDIVDAFERGVAASAASTASTCIKVSSRLQIVSSVHESAVPAVDDVSSMIPHAEKCATLVGVLYSYLTRPSDQQRLPKPFLRRVYPGKHRIFDDFTVPFLSSLLRLCF